MMNEFLSLLEDGMFCPSHCSSCNRVSWPITPVCVICLSPTALVPLQNKTGTLIEYTATAPSSAGETEIFALVDLSGVRLVGTLVCNHAPTEGDKVQLSRCALGKDGAPYFEFQVA